MKVIFRECPWEIGKAEMERKGTERDGKADKGCSHHFGENGAKLSMHKVPHLGREEPDLTRTPGRMPEPGGSVREGDEQANVRHTLVTRCFVWDEMVKVGRILARSPPSLSSPAVGG